MTTPRRYRDLSAKSRRRLIRQALIRPTAITGVLLALYFLLPMDRAFTPATLVLLVAGLGVVVLLVILQAHTIARSQHPILTAITALAATIPLFLLGFSSIYFLMEQSSHHTFTQPMTRLDALYFSTTVLATVGFGDIAPRSEVARAVTTVQMLADLVLVGFVVRVFLRAAGPPPPAPINPRTDTDRPD